MQGQGHANFACHSRLVLTDLGLQGQDYTSEQDLVPVDLIWNLGDKVL